jgi:cyclic pyranopterin phosphate synthase
VPFQDDFGRPINYLRVSVTDRCNLRCVYCMPAEGVEQCSHHEILRYEEMALIIRAAAGLGISQVRLTGGEPLVRRGLPEFVRTIAAIPGIQDIAMTTNGVLLAAHARSLADAGLHRINVSLDTLRPDRFARITRLGRIEDVWAGIEAAQAAGLAPIKLNMVVVRSLNDDEVAGFARRTLTAGWHVRFIELMPIGTSAGWAGDGAVPIAEIRDRIEREVAPLAPVEGPPGNGPARYFRFPAAQGTVGFIGALSEHFCAACNRLRLTADGRLRPCLMDAREIDLRSALRTGAGVEALREILEQAIRVKPRGHRLGQAESPRDRTMAQIGG